MNTSSDIDQALAQSLAMSRFGLGANVSGVSALNGSARQLLRDEIDRGQVANPGAGALPGSSALIAEVLEFQKRRTELDKQGIKAPSPVTARVDAEIASRFHDAMLTTPVGFGERLVMFWANHFAVSVDKAPPVHMSAGAYEREAIRPHVFGRFTELLLAVETHPSMLYYLDNVGSTGPNSDSGRRQRKGINENLAREIMELHTIGVGAGYSQADVTAFAEALTGWTANKNPDIRTPVGTFVFRSAVHEPGEKTILGQTYSEDGFFQAADVLVRLARDPATARHLSTKLARHFVADPPPPALVEQLTDTWLKTDGDLQAVYITLIDADTAWAPQPGRLRTPQEHLVAMMRATGLKPSPAEIKRHTAAMGQPIWKPSSPAGFADTDAAWLTPSGLSARMQVAEQIATEVGDDADPRAVAEAVLGPRLSDMTRDAIARADSTRQGLSLVFMSPEFLRR